MRLSEEWRAIIKEAAEEVFGPGTKVYLFGSRVDDRRRGGDLDLYIVPAQPGDFFEKKTRFLSRLWSRLGEQKIDVIIARDPEHPVEKMARKEGLLL